MGGDYKGSQYISDAYLLLLKTWGIKPSMSRKGNCWDNAVAESFFLLALKKNGYLMLITEIKQKPVLMLQITETELAD